MMRDGNNQDANRNNLRRCCKNMKVLMKPIEMIAWFTRDGKPNPIRYKIVKEYEDGDNIIINVDRIITRAEEKLAGNRMIVFKCQSVFDGTEKLYELKYEINTCKWFLYKM